MADKITKFDDETIQRLFGHEAAEDEILSRLRQYYFKTTTYEDIMSTSRMKILVGHKGIGKSALFQVAISESRDLGELVISVQPNDVANIATTQSNFLVMVNNWIDGLAKLIVDKALHTYGIPSNEIILYNHDIVQIIIDKIRSSSEQIPESKKETASSFLKNPVISVYIDDLDRGWQGKKDDVIRISALLNAIRDINRENHQIKFRIAIRSDVYYLVRTSDESTDKIEGSVIWHSWSNHEIFAMLVKRVETYFGRNVDESYLVSKRQYELASYLSPIFEGRFSGRGHWENAPMYKILMSLIRKRPRDLVKLCSLAAKKARIENSTLIRTSDLESVFQRYSQERIQDTINEYKSEMPNIERLISNMRPYRKERETRQGYVYTTAQLLDKIGTIMQNHPLEFAGQRIPPTRQNIASFLYKINFLTARKETSHGIIRSYFEENRYLASEFVDHGFQWEIHPAYRWALQPESINDIFASLELSSDEN